MAFERIKVLLERLQQRFNADEYSELQRELAAADEEIKELQAVRERHKEAEATRRLGDHPVGETSGRLDDTLLNQ